MPRSDIFGELVEQHAHLGSSSTPHFLWETAHDQGIKLQTKNYWEFIESVTIKEKTTYDDYLHYFHFSELVQSSVMAVERSVHNSISLSYRKSNITTMELRFNPMFRNRKNIADLDKIIIAAIYGMKKAMLDYPPVKAGLILMMDRRLSGEENLIIAKKAVKYKNDGIVGIDIGGPIKDSFRIADISDAYKLAREAGLKTTIHTGEVTPVTEIWEVIEKLKPDRIGHGIRAVDDPGLLKELAKRKIVLELCPTSNIMTRAARSWEEINEIISALRKNRVPFTINSDGPGFLGTNVRKEFSKLLEKGIIKRKEIDQITKTARKTSFLNV